MVVGRRQVGLGRQLLAGMRPRYRLWPSHRDALYKPQRFVMGETVKLNYDGPCFAKEALILDVKGDRTITAYDIAGEVLLPPGYQWDGPWLTTEYRS